MNTVDRYLAALKRATAVAVSEYRAPGSFEGSLRPVRFDTEEFVPDPKIDEIQKRILALRNPSLGCGGCLTLGLLTPITDMKISYLEHQLGELQRSDQLLWQRWNDAQVHRRKRFVEVLNGPRPLRDGEARSIRELVATLANVQLNDSRPSKSAVGASLVALPGESVVMEYRASLGAYQDVGYSLDAGFEGNIRQTSTGIAVSTDHVVVSEASARGSLGGEIRGQLARKQAFQIVDEGRLALTTRRVVFLGQRRSYEIRLGEVLGAGGSPRTLDVKWPGQRNQEQFIVCDGDLLAQLVLMLKALGEGRDQASPVNDAPLVSTRIERPCPWCAELILKQARVCKHCGRDVG